LKKIKLFIIALALALILFTTEYKELKKVEFTQELNQKVEKPSFTTKSEEISLKQVFSEGEVAFATIRGP